MREGSKGWDPAGDEACGELRDECWRVLRCEAVGGGEHASQATAMLLRLEPDRDERAFGREIIGQIHERNGLHFLGIGSGGLDLQDWICMIGSV